MAKTVAAGSKRQQDFSPVQAIVNPNIRKKGWSAGGQVLLPHAAVFTLRAAVETAGRMVIICSSYLNERQPSAIGRFRLLATADDPPIPTEAVTLPLLPEETP